MSKAEVERLKRQLELVEGRLARLEGQAAEKGWTETHLARRVTPLARKQRELELTLEEVQQ